METRAAIESILDQAYAARCANQAEAAAACFAEDAHFKANGAPAPATNRAEHVSAMTEMFTAFEVVGFKQYYRIIDPPYAAVFWRGTFRAPTGRVGDADILDLIEVRDGKISSLTSFFDTAYAQALVAPA